MSRSFKYKDKVYTLPEDKVEGFLSEATGAFEVKKYKYNDKVYNLPLDKVDSFLSDAPNAEFLGEESTPDPLKKKESVSAEPLPDFYTNTTGQTSTEADPVLQSFQEQDPLSVREMGRTEESPMPVEQPSGVPTFAKRQEEEWKAPLLAEEQPQPQHQDPLGVRETFGMGQVEDYSQYLEENPAYFDEGMSYAIDSEVPTIERTGTRQSSERFYKPEDLKEEAAWNYFKKHRGYLAPHQLAVLEGALERNAPKKYAQYRLEKYRANKDRTNQEWVRPEDTREYLELKNDYGQSDEMLKLLKEGKNQAVLDMLSNLDKQGLLNESQRKGLQKILSSEDQEDRTLEMGGTFAPAPQMPQQKKWNFPIDSKATTSFIREIVKEGDYFEDDIKEDDSSFTRGRKGYKHAMHNATIALSKDKEDVIGYFEYLHQKNLRTEPKKQHGLFSAQGMLEMAGGVLDQTAISGGAGFLASAVGTPAAGVAVGTATASGMSAYQGYGQSFEEAYSKARSMGINKEKSYEVAQLQAKAGAVGGAIEGAAGALVGAKVPTKGLLGKIGMFLLDPAVAGASKMAQNIYGESLGLDYTDFEGVPENMLGELMFGGAMTGVSVTGKQVFNWWKQLPTDQKINVVAKVDQAKEASVETVETEEVTDVETPTVTTPEQPTEVVESKVLTQEESLEAQKDRDIQTVKDAIAEAERTGQVPMINGREVSEATIDEINIDYEQKLAKLQQETDAAIQPTNVEKGLDTETTGTEGTPVTQELEGTEQVTGTGEGIREGDPTDTGGVIDGKPKTESDIDPTAEAEGTGRTGTTETEDTDGGQIEGEQSRTEGEDTEGDAVLPKEESTVQDDGSEIDTSEDVVISEDELDTFEEESKILTKGVDTKRKIDQEVKEAKKQLDEISSESDYKQDKPQKEDLARKRYEEALKKAEEYKRKKEQHTSILSKAINVKKRIEASLKGAKEKIDQVAGEPRPERRKTIKHDEVHKKRYDEAVRKANEYKANKDQKETNVSDIGMAHAKETGGVAHEVGNELGLIQGFNMRGKPIYAPYKGNKRLTVDIGNKIIIKNKFLTEQEIDSLRQLKKDLEAKEKSKQKDPFKEQGRVASTDSVPQEVKSFVSKITESLGVDKKIFIITDKDLTNQQFEKHGLFGNLSQIRSVQISANDPSKYGGTRYMKDADAFYIYYGGNLDSKQSFAVISHEIGHIVEKTILDATPIEVQNRIQNEYNKWYSNLTGKKLNEVINETRDVLVHDLFQGVTGNFDPKKDRYISSFSEYFADNVAKWMRTSEKPRTQVEKIFKTIADELKKVYDYVFKTGNYSKSIFEWLDDIYQTDISGTNPTNEMLSSMSAGESKDVKLNLSPQDTSVVVKMIKDSYKKTKKLTSSTLNEAYQYAKDKGYKGSESEFSKWFVDYFKKEGKAKRLAERKAKIKNKGLTDKEAKLKAEAENTLKTADPIKDSEAIRKAKLTIDELSEKQSKFLEEQYLLNKGFTDEELKDKASIEAFLKDSDAPKDDPVRKKAEDKLKSYEDRQKKFDDNYLKKFSTVRKAYNEIKSAFNKGKRGERTDIINRLAQVKDALNQFIKENKDSFKKVEGADVPNISTKITNLNPRVKDLEGEIDRVVTRLEAILVKAEDNDLKDKIKKESSKLTNKFKTEKVKGYKKAIDRAKYIVKNISKVKDKVSLAKAVNMLNDSTSQSKKAVVSGLDDINALLDKAMADETISDTDYNNFLDNKVVSEKTKKDIIQKLENKELLSPREREIFEDKDISFDEQITRLEAIADSKTKEMSDEDIELLDSKIRSFSERNLDTLSPEIKEKVEILSSIPLDSTSPRKKLEIVKALEKAVINDSDDGIAGLIDLANGVARGEAASKRITETGTRGLVAEFVEKAGATWASFTQNLEAIANKNEASVLREVFLQPLQKAKASINAEFNSIMDSVTDVYHDIRKTDPTIDSNENVYERSIYSTLNMFIKGSNINERNAQYKEVNNLINNTVEYYKAHPRIAKEKNIDIDALEKVWNKYKGLDPYASENATSPNDIISDNNKKIVDAYKKEYETKLKDKIFEQNDKYKGEMLPEIENYLAVGIIKTKAKSQGDPEAGLDGFRSDNFNNMILSTSASSRKKRKIKYSKDDILDLNFDLVQERNINNTLQDLYLTSAFNEVNGALMSGGMLDKLGRDRVDAIKRLADSWVREELGAYRKNLNSRIERATARLADLGYAVTLGTPEQAIKQSIPVLTSAAMNLGVKDAPLLAQAAGLLINPRTKGFIKEMMAKTDIGQRGFRKVENPDAKARIHRESNKFARTINTKLSKLGFKEKINPTDLAMIFTELGDNATAKASWLAYYMQSLKKQGIDISNTGLSSSQKKRKATLERQLEIARTDEKGRYKESKTDALGRESVEMSDVASIQKELDALNDYESKSWTGEFNDQAAAYASQQVSKTQNVSDQNERARLVKKGDEAAAPPYVRNTLLSFQGFAINNKFRLANDIAKGNVKGITAAVAEDLIFNSLSGIIGKGMLGFATNAFLGAEDEGWDKRLDRAKKKAIMGLPKLINPFNVAGGIGDDLLGDIVNSIAAYSKGQDLIEYLNDDPLYRNYDRDDKFGLYSLGLGVPLAIADDISILLSDTVYRDAYVGNKVVERQTAAAKKVALYHLVATALSVGVPVSQVERMLRKEKERLLKEGEPSDGYSSGGSMRRSNFNVRKRLGNTRGRSVGSSRRTPSRTRTRTTRTRTN